MDRLPEDSQRQPYKADFPMRLSRRSALKLFGALSAGAVAAAIPNPPFLAYAAGTTVLDANDPRLIPFPGKRALLQDASFTSQVGSSAAMFPLPSLDNPSIYPIAEWNTGHYPNYSDSAYVDGRPFVWVATFGDRSITRLDVRSGTTTSFHTGVGTLPLDVAYDNMRKQIVVASADEQATMVVLNISGEIVKQLSLAELTGQGPSVGGAQGVTIDGAGNYWFALSYYGAGSYGAVVKIDGNSHTARLVIKDAGLHNPNGILFVDEGPYVLALSDDGYAHQFGLDGAFQRRLSTTHAGYRGEVHDGQLWVSSYSQTGEMVRVDLATEKRGVFYCVPRANSIRVDHNGFVWVAGDEGLSVSTVSGQLVAISETNGFANGLTSIDNKMFHASSGHNGSENSNTMTQVAAVSVRSLLPGVSSSKAASS